MTLTDLPSTDHPRGDTRSGPVGDGILLPGSHQRRDPQKPSAAGQSLCDQLQQPVETHVVTELVA